MPSWHSFCGGGRIFEGLTRDTVPRSKSIDAHSNCRHVVRMSRNDIVKTRSFESESRPRAEEGFMHQDSPYAPKSIESKHKTTFSWMWSWSLIMSPWLHSHCLGPWVPEHIFMVLVLGSELRTSAIFFSLSWSSRPRLHFHGLGAHGFGPGHRLWAHDYIFTVLVVEFKITFSWSGSSILSPRQYFHGLGPWVWV